MKRDFGTDQRGLASRKQREKAVEIIAHEAAQFIAREAGTESLITVIRAESVAHGDRMLVFVSVFPEDKAQAALRFLERRREAFSDHLKAHARMRLPRVDFLLDNRDYPMGEFAKS